MSRFGLHGFRNLRCGNPKPRSSKYRDVIPFRDAQNNRLVFALGFKIVLQLAPQMAELGAHNVVGRWIEIQTPFEHVARDLDFT